MNATCCLAVVAAALGIRAEPPDGERRAGYPSWVAPWARPSDTGRTVGCIDLRLRKTRGGVNRPHGHKPLRFFT